MSEIKDSSRKTLEPNVIVPTTNMVSYSSYLKVNELLKLQDRLSTPPEHDEMLFIIIHQVYELWFKQILHELDLAEKCLNDKNAFGALKTLKRITTIQKTLTDQVSILETMTPNDFNRFRSRLNPASGFQSWQFRLVEFRMGLKDSDFLKFYQSNPEAIAQISAAQKLPSFYDHLLKFISASGINIPSEVLQRDVNLHYEPNTSVEEAYLSIYRNHEKYSDLYVLLESLMDLDQQFTLWRFRHVAMVERMIGTRTGTGGSSGVKYLSSTLSKRFFPELWTLRSKLGDGSYGQ